MGYLLWRDTPRYAHMPYIIGDSPSDARGGDDDDDHAMEGDIGVARSCSTTVLEKHICNSATSLCCSNSPLPLSISITTVPSFKSMQGGRRLYLWSVTDPLVPVGVLPWSALFYIYTIQPHGTDTDYVHLPCSTVWLEDPPAPDFWKLIIGCRLILPRWSSSN